MSQAKPASRHFNLHTWVKRGDSALPRLLKRAYYAIRYAEMPTIKPLHRALYEGYRGCSSFLAETARIVLWTPLLKSRLANSPKHLYLYSGLPMITGPLEIRIGDGSRVSGHTTFSGRVSGFRIPKLTVGSNVDIGWQTSIAVGHNVILQDNVRIAGRCVLAGYPGHPLEADARARGLPETEDQVGDIILEDNVWLATGVSVMAGVRIGRNTVVAAGSVVTKDLPPNVLAGGIPARVIRSLDNQE